MSSHKIRVVVVGATGYVGLDLIKILSRHPKVQIKYLCAQKKLGKKIQFFDKTIKNKKLPKISNIKSVDWNEVDVLFTSLPTGQAQIIAKKLIKYNNLKIIDLAADFRLNDPKIYKKYYGKKHRSVNLLKQSIYSISEFVKDKISNFKIISCPGCYPTSIQLPLIPLLKNNLIKKNNIIIDSKSGYSGAGKNLKKKFNHKNLFSSIHAYGINKHRHTSEIDQQFRKVNKIKINYIFTPHLIPTFRGMLSTIYIETKKGIPLNKIYKCLKKYHKKNYFVKIMPINRKLGTENVLNTNFCEISICRSNIKNKLIILSAIDNLIKGAAGQAVQNMNLVFGYNEKLGLN